MPEMKALVVTSPGHIEIQTVPVPQPGPYEALVRIEACSFCSSTDLKIIDGSLPFVRDYPCILGHESVGVVAEVGDKVRYLSEGQRVLRPVAAYPSQRLGDLYSGWGGFAQFGLVTDWRAAVEDLAMRADRVNAWFKMHQIVPKGISPPHATMLITLKETLSSLQALGDVSGRSVLIIGDGAVGLCFARWAKLLGAFPVAVAGHHENRLSRARSLGVDFAVDTSRQTLTDALASAGAPSAGWDFVIDAVGSGDAIQQAYRLLASGGRLGIYGVSDHMTASMDFLTLPVGAAVVRMSTDEPAVHEQVLSAVQLGTINLSDFCTHVLPLEQAAQGIELLRTRQALKVVLTMSAGQ